MTSPPLQTDDYFRDSPQNIRETRPFYWMVMLVLAVFYFTALAYTPVLHEPLPFVGFTVLMIAHAALHWISPYLTTRRRWFVPYYFIQGILAFVIVLVAPNQGIALGLYLGLAGEVVGFLEDLRRSILPVAGYLALSAINFGLLWGWNALSWWAIAITPMAFFVIVYVSMFVRQARARDQAQKLLRELETAHRQLAEYAARVEDLTLANERQRMARELHDTLAQGLAGLILQLEAANSHLADGRTERTQAILQQAMARARATLTDARRAIDDLRAGQSLAQDLQQALREEINRFTNATSILCDLEIALPPILPDSTREHTLRVVSEGLTNIARHAQAHRAYVRVATADDHLNIEVCDDGRGFDPSITQAGHYGLLGMRERARLAGGTLVVESAPGRGTMLKLVLPLREESK